MLIQLSNGTSYEGTLIVRNVTGIGEERGYRLFWEHPDGCSIMAVDGYATSHPYRTRREAIAAGQARFGVTPRVSR